MMKNSSDNSFPFVFPFFPETRVNGELPAGTVLNLARSQARFASLCGDEIARFALERIERDREFLAEVGSCRDWDAMNQAQASWALDAVRDYVQESGRIFELFQEIYAEAISPAGYAKPKAKRGKQSARQRPVP